MQELSETAKVKEKLQKEKQENRKLRLDNERLMKFY
jgi:regulator of replication initiation timing